MTSQPRGDGFNYPGVSMHLATYYRQRQNGRVHFESGRVHSQESNISGCDLLHDRIYVCIYMKLDLQNTFSPLEITYFQY